MITLALTLFIVVASIVQSYADTILHRTRTAPAKILKPDCPPRAEPSRTTRSRTKPAEPNREKILDSLAFYDDQLTRLQALAEAARAAEKAARRAVDVDADADRYGAATTEKIRAKHAAELDRATRRVISLNRQIYTYETAREKAAQKVEGQKMRIYTAESTRRNGDSFTLCVSYNRADAERAAENDRFHMTKAERAATVTSVQAFDVDTLPGESARAAWERLLDVDEWPADPAEYAEIE